jgi:hypothetical protein
MTTVQETIPSALREDVDAALACRDARGCPLQRKTNP